MILVDEGGAAARTETAAPGVRPQWSSKLAFLAAAVGSAVGLGSIWKFPYIVGANGGGAFVLVYLFFVAAVGVPLMTAELTIGRRGGPSVIRSLGIAAGRMRTRWNAFGWMGVIAAFVILSFYSVVAGWAVAYAMKALVGDLSGANAVDSAADFAALLADPAEMIGWHSLFILGTAFIVAQGVSAGIERAVRWLMPVFAALLIGLAIYAAIAGDFARGAAFLFKPDFSALTPTATLSAAGHAFFTLSLGMGAMIAYGGYLARDTSTPRTAAWVAGADTVCSLAAGLAIFPIVFAFGLDPAEGPGLVFVALPVAFAGMPFGGVVAFLFFALLVIAALVSAVSVLEPLVAATGAEGPGPVRQRRTWAFTGAAWALGLVSVLSFNVWEEIRVPVLDRNLFDTLNYLTSDVLLPVVGVGIALFVGWVAPSAAPASEFQSAFGRRIWLFLVRFVAPAVVALVLFDALT
jgi:NSS family neurotransmitter:Na+ symporter